MGEELSDDEWTLIEPLLPGRKRRGRPRTDDRRSLNGILWVLRSGARWKDLPPMYGSRSTCHRRLNQWQDQGVWEKIRLTFLSTLDRQAKLDWIAAFLDGSFAGEELGHRYPNERGRAAAANQVDLR
ncbi:MAG: IS5 family transposase [Chloroflexi bacterium]|nr:IS5 family transposase [Chloroflexota bacterium]